MTAYLPSFFIIFATFFASLFLTGRIKNLLLKRAILDVPNDRSSHKIAVPRGGGWALVLILVPALAVAIYYLDQDLRHAGLLIGTLLLTGISWADDRAHISAWRRLSLHIMAACLGSFSFAPTEMLLGGALPFWCDRTLMILGWAWFINLYNFMDGIDGLTGVESICIANGICIIMSAAGIADPFTDFLTLILMGSCLGFLAYNWHPAKIFLGDVGSVPLGYVTGFCLIALAVKGHPVASLILPLYYLADSSITIGKRALRGEKIWQAHRQHFYQKAAAGLRRHDKVVYWIIAGNIGLIAAALLSVSMPFAGLAVGIAVVALLLQTLHKAAS